MTPIIDGWHAFRGWLSRKIAPPPRHLYSVRSGSGTMRRLVAATSVEQAERIGRRMDKEQGIA